MRLLAVAAILLMPVTLLVGCAADDTDPSGSRVAVSPSAAAGSPSSPAVASPDPSAGSASPPARAAASLELPTRTETEWGPIWDALPPSFPVFPGAIPTDTRAGPVSAELALPTDVATAADWYRRALEAIGFRTVGFSEPLEDGSVVIDSVGAEGCGVQITLIPLSGTTNGRILYGAGCPFG
jgi:hypothetical protein